MRRGFDKVVEDNRPVELLGCETINIMDVDHPERDQAWDERARQESSTERLDRNWNSLLQELRVVQTGVQLLTGFLLTLPFQQRFEELDSAMRVVYLLTTASSIAATVLLIAPVGLHRMLFRQRRLQVLVSVAHRFAYAGLLMLGVALTGVVTVVFDAVAGAGSALIAGTTAGLGFIAFWLVLPLALRIGGTRRGSRGVCVAPPGGIPRRSKTAQVEVNGAEFIDQERRDV